MQTLKSKEAQATMERRLKLPSLPVEEQLVEIEGIIKGYLIMCNLQNKYKIEVTEIGKA